MNKSSIQKKANLMFLIILFMGISYFSILYFVLNNYLVNFLNQVWMLFNLKGALDFLFELCTTSSIFLSFIVLLVTTIFSLKIAFSFVIYFQNYLRIWTKINITSKKNTSRYTILQDGSDSAFTFGLFNSKIYLGSGLMDKLKKNQLEVILLHEEGHIANGDNIKQLITEIIKNSFPNFPFKKTLFNNFEVLRELCADMYVKERIGSIRPLIESLYEYMSLGVNYNYGYLGFGFEKMNRLEILTGNKNLKTRTTVFLAIFISIFSSIIGVVVASANQGELECRVDSFPIQIESIKAKESNSSTPCLQTYDMSTSYCIIVSK